MTNHLIMDKTYLPPLEGWRGVLALSVVFFHFSQLYFDAKYAPWGYLAVDFFFALSGFIIARQYEASIVMRTVDFKKFAIRRLARLYPLYAFSILVAVLINQYTLEWDSPLKIQDFGFGPSLVMWVIVQLTMTGALFMLPQPNGPTWSVSAEWVVNIVFFGLVWRYRRIPNVLLWSIVACGALYLISVSPQTLETPTKNVPMARAIVGFCLGWLIFRYHKKLPVIQLSYLYVFETVLMIITLWMTVYHDDVVKAGGDYIFELILIPTLITVSLYRGGIIGFIFSLPVCTFLGRISYSIYLLHYPLTYLVVHNDWLMSFSSPSLGILYIGILIVVATTAYIVIEKPGRALGRYLTRKPIAVEGAPAPAVAN
ncbi:MAG: acyltransferase [Proteobacteria bacterium]|nr:acyltransferase [Pseudomonadota bacterium]